MGSEDIDKTISRSEEALLRFLDSPLPRSDSRRSTSDADYFASPDTSHASCPGAANYFRLAMGTVPDEEADSLLTHIASCDSCAGLLTKSLHALEGNPSPEEIAAIAELAAARAEWQQGMAHKLASTSVRRRPVFRRPILTFSTIAAGILIAAAFLVSQHRRHSPEHELAQAYTESRGLELRIPGADYAGFASGSHTRGVTQSHESAYLLEARAHLARLMERSPQEARVLQLQARADVLEEHYDAAVDVLDRLLAAGPVTAELLTDAASAYYQRGLVSGSELDRSTALDYLRRADELSPADPVILFNEAIVMEDRGQIMNAVEIWNRFLAVEHNQEWAAEGKRKLAALEQTLNRLKTHDSRVTGMLSSPEATDALAGNSHTLAAIDEELSSMQLDRLLPVAFPTPPSPKSGQQARGSPCSLQCEATRRLLKALSISLQSTHNDLWLADLLLPDVNSLSAPHAQIYAQALESLAKATREDQTGIPQLGLQSALQSQELFQQLTSDSSPELRQAAQVGEERAAVEHLFALQRIDDYRTCYAYAQQLRARPFFRQTASRYPWMNTITLLTEKICGDTPETRAAGRALTVSSLQLAEAAHYSILRLRIQARTVDAAQSFDDGETTEQTCLAVLRKIYASDLPPYRVVNTLSEVVYIEIDSPRAHTAESSLREMIAWEELIGNKAAAAELRFDLARIEIKIGAMKEAERQLNLAGEEAKATSSGNYQGANLGDTEARMANSMLEWGDLPKAAHFLELAQKGMVLDTDRWTQEQYVITRGMLELSLGNYAGAASLLQASIESNEGRNTKVGDSTTAAEYARHDHDLYTELAAAWLAQGRSPGSVLALWERFRLRARGLPITQCARHQLDCEQPRLLLAQSRMGNSMLIGQIILLDRVLIYTVDKDNILWEQRPIRRQDVVDTAQTFERAVSSPLTSAETARTLGAKLSSILLPSLPKSSGSDFSLLLEPDPLLENLSWPVLPTTAGPLGIQYPLAESRSILAYDSMPPFPNTSMTTSSKSVDEPIPGMHPLIVGASVTESGEPPLPETLNEAATVSRFLHSPSVLLGKQANLENVAANLGSATTFHFAGHALQTEHGTQLLLAAARPKEASPWIDGAFLHQHPPRNCRLAVLSACSTGRQEASWKHPLQDIVETMSSLGVPNVVATRWQIDSKATVPFMDAFYSSLAKGGSPAMALAYARKLQSGQVLYNNPYYWGAYYVTTTESLNRRRTVHVSRYN